MVRDQLIPPKIENPAEQFIDIQVCHLLSQKTETLLILWMVPVIILPVYKKCKYKMPVKCIATEIAL